MQAYEGNLIPGSYLLQQGSTCKAEFATAMFTPVLLCIHIDAYCPYALQMPLPKGQ